MDQVDLWVDDEIVSHALQGTVEVVVVAVEVGHNVTGGPNETLVNGMPLSAVFLTDPIRDAILEFFDDVDTAICAAAIDDNVFEVWIILTEHRQNGLL